MIQDNPQQADLAYAAGYFDGEGCFNLSHTPRQKSFNATICSLDYEGLKWFQDHFGGSLSEYNSSSTWTKKQMYAWKLSGHGTYAFVTAILPYLKYKREHAMFCVRAWESRSNTDSFIKDCTERRKRWGRAAAETK